MFWFSVFVKPLIVSVEEKGSSVLKVSWTLPQLTHGIYCGLEIFYRLNSSLETLRVVVLSGVLEYELTSLLPYTYYAISTRPYTLEGEGRKSDEVLVRTGEAGK